MVVFGVDPGTAITGYGVILENENSSLEMIDCGAIRTSSNLPDWERLQVLYQQISQLLSLHQPDCGAVEKLYFQRNVTNAMTVGQARGVVLLAMAQKGLKVGEYTPLQIKQAVVGYGRADKDQIQRMVTTLLSLAKSPTPDDVSDALAVAICHINSNRFNKLIEK